ncbi:MAG: YqaE/Pmp3 family membrane protein [Brumimicrobium sp.]|nr:YqaE/Pmp3 family membrane protein [Brumimicrobium sp.]
MNDGGLFQKRKHNKGWFVKSNSSDLKGSAKTEKTDFKGRENLATKTESKDETSRKIVVQPVDQVQDMDEKRQDISETDLKEKPEGLDKGTVLTDEYGTNKAVTAKLKERIAKPVKKVQETNSLAKDDFNKSGSNSADGMFVLLLILCFFIPPLAVAIITKELLPTLLNLLLTLLFVLPGIIHALIVLFNRY